MKDTCSTCGHDCHCQTVECLHANRAVRTRSGVKYRENGKQCKCTRCKCPKSNGTD